MSIQNVVNRQGKKPNTFELLMLARLLQMLKDGCFYKNSNPWEVDLSTSKLVLDQLRALQPPELLTVAAKVLALLSVKDQDKFARLTSPEQDFEAWLRLMTQAEAND
jgi:hypothetical protein